MARIADFALVIFWNERASRWEIVARAQGQVVTMHAETAAPMTEAVVWALCKAVRNELEAGLPF